MRLPAIFDRPSAEVLQAMLRLYDFLPSGNGYKVRLMLAERRRAYEFVLLDITRGETRTPAFLAKNANGRIPVLELADGRRLPESNAISWYLAEGTPWLPDDPWQRAQVLRWLFFEQYSHEPYVATVRYWVSILGKGDEWRDRVEERRKGGYAALGVMEGALKGRDWLVGERPTLADVALYAYTHVAGEGGFDLGPYPAVRAWLDRFAARPGHFPIDAAVPPGAVPRPWRPPT
jgi:glutathione S-transferase